MAFTYFFRDLQTLDMIRRYVLPSLRTRRYIHIWDAGCAMGPEPYSLAIILKENMGNMIFRNVKIHATDIDESGNFGDIIKKGLYPEEQVKRIPKEIFSKYFGKDGKPGVFKISEEIRKSVSFQRHDLIKVAPLFDFLYYKGPCFRCHNHLCDECFSGGSDDIQYYPGNLFWL